MFWLQSLVKLLCETKENNKSLQFEADDLRQKLADAQGDIKVSVLDHVSVSAAEKMRQLHCYDPTKPYLI